MKNCILIPTYEGHKYFLNYFLYSISVNTPKNISIYLIVSKDDYNIFVVMARNYVDLNINVLILSDIMREIYKIYIDENFMLERLGKVTYQSMKKIYGVIHLMNNNYDNVIVFDSECMIIKYIDINDYIDEYIKKKKNPYVIYSTCESSNSHIHGIVLNNANSLIGTKNKNIWLLEYYLWIYEKNIIYDFYKYIKNRYIFCENLYEIFSMYSDIFIENVYFAFIYNS